MGKPSIDLESLVNHVTQVDDLDLVKLKASIESEARRRGFKLAIGDIGERLAIEHFNETPGLPNLQLAPTGTKNVDALSRDGDRFSIKTIQSGKKTGTIYADPHDRKKQLFEYLVIVALDGTLCVKSIHQFTWEQFLNVRSWDSRMNAWYVPFSTKARAKSNILV